MAKKKRKSKPSLEPDLPTFRHCDEYIDDPTSPEPLRKFLDRARAPAHGALLPGPYPTLFADYQGKRVRVVMASRFGHVGITEHLDREHGYELAIPVEFLSNFSETT